MEGDSERESHGAALLSRLTKKRNYFVIFGELLVATILSFVTIYLKYMGAVLYIYRGKDDTRN